MLPRELADWFAVPRARDEGRCWNPGRPAEECAELGGSVLFGDGVAEGVAEGGCSS